MESAAGIPLSSIRTLPLPEELQVLFSRAVRLAMQPANANPVRPWLHRHYDGEAVYRRLLPEKQRAWDRERSDLTAAPTKGELEYVAGKSMEGWSCQSARSFKEHLAQHREAAKHPAYSTAIAERRARLLDLKNERRKWRPTLEERLRLAVDDVVDAEYPDGSQHIEHARRVVAIVALLMPEPLPMLGELGDHPFASKLRLSEQPTGDWLVDLLMADAAAASMGPHGYRPTELHMRDVGREEVMFVRESDGRRTIRPGFPLDGLLNVLRIAVEELEAATPALRPRESPTPRRSGRLPKSESEAKRTAMLAMVRQHPSLKDDPDTLAGILDVSDMTIRRWLEDEERKYRKSAAARGATTKE